MCKSVISFLLFTFPLIAFLNCNRTNHLPQARTKLLPEADGIIRDIPGEQRGAYNQLMRRRADSSLALKPLKDGYKGLQIRIWTGSGMTFRGRLFVIETDNRTWSGNLYYFRDTFNRQYVGEVLIEKISLNQSTRQWLTLINEFFALGIDTLPDYTLLPKYSLDMDEDGVLVEIAQGRFYKSYYYPTPRTRTTEFKEARQMAQIVELVDKKFGNKLDDPAYGVQHRLSTLQAEE